MAMMSVLKQGAHKPTRIPYIFQQLRAQRKNDLLAQVEYWKLETRTNSLEYVDHKEAVCSDAKRRV